MLCFGAFKPHLEAGGIFLKWNIEKHGHNTLQSRWEYSEGRSATRHALICCYFMFLSRIKRCFESTTRNFLFFGTEFIQHVHICLSKVIGGGGVTLNIPISKGNLNETYCCWNQARSRNPEKQISIFSIFQKFIISTYTPPIFRPLAARNQSGHAKTFVSKGSTGCSRTHWRISWFIILD